MKHQGGLQRISRRGCAVDGSKPIIERGAAGARRVLVRVLMLLCVLVVSGKMAADEAPVWVGIDAEFGVEGSTSAQAIRLGATIAVEEINAAGGVLGGRPLALIETDNRSVPARSAKNLRELAAVPDLVAVLSGRYSPVVVAALPVVHELGLPLLDPWAAADPITEHGFEPDFVFRLSIKDTWAIAALLEHAEQRGLRQIGLLLSNTEWGRSSQRAAQAYLQRKRELKIAETRWFNWGQASLREEYRALRAAGAEAIILVANEREGDVLVKELANEPPEDRLPVLAHWGITGGTFFEKAGSVLDAVDLVVVQTFSFLNARGPVAERVMAAIARQGTPDPRRIASPVGVAHAYDLVHLLARALDLAGSTDRSAVRLGLEQVTDHAGLVKYYAHPFAPGRHDALDEGDVFIARYAADGAIEPIAPLALDEAVEASDSASH